DLRVAARAALRHGVRLFGAGPPFLHRPEDLRDDLAGARDLHPVALANVLRGNQRGVVQRRVRDRDAPDLDGLEDGVGIERAGPTHVDADLAQLRDLDLRRELAGHRPARLAVPD